MFEVKKLIDNVCDFIINPPNWIGDNKLHLVHLEIATLKTIVIQTKKDELDVENLEYLLDLCANVLGDGKARSIGRFRLAED